VTASPGLEVDGLTITFGGVVAVSGVSLSAPLGSVTGLIGPNGAGKTTTFAGCSGLVRPAKGRVRLFGADITSASPAKRAQAGLGRTFQRVEVCESMTVRANVLVGAEARVAGANPLRHLGLSGRAATNDRVDAALQRCGLEPLAEQPVRTLSTGQKRLVELARVLAGDFRFLLLDEPSSGLDDTETERFGEILRGIVEEVGVGILLVEHDMDLVMGVCRRLHVLEFGHLIFSGTPAETRSSELVRAAYLGADADTVGAV
jgi:ABC-type branched-subunit amino acid transport system ATPase component